MNGLVYVIEQIWVDPSENINERALGYKPIGFTLDEQKAINFCSKGQDYTSKDCWAIGIFEKDEKLPEFRYKPLQELSTTKE
ncbi:MAG: hypothetical protein U9Q69_01295 [Nanoarchaeota archaeon]|nr:hypothetical protein [Nanoarchaeota archaeon]